MSTYYPDKWILLETSNGIETTYKVFAGWFGGFAGADSWKLSSGVTNVKKYENRYEFENFSGSTYVCLNAEEGLSSYMHRILDNFLEQIKDLPEYKMTIVDIKNIDSSKYIKS